MSLSSRERAEARDLIARTAIRLGRPNPLLTQRDKSLMHPVVLEVIYRDDPVSSIQQRLDIEARSAARIRELI